MFRGVFEHQIDAKGRTSFPVKLRDTLVGSYDDRLIVTTALDACLHCYPVREWEQFETALARENRGGFGEGQERGIRGFAIGRRLLWYTPRATRHLFRRGRPARKRSKKGYL